MTNKEKYNKVRAGMEFYIKDSKQTNTSFRLFNEQVVKIHRNEEGVFLFDRYEGNIFSESETSIECMKVFLTETITSSIVLEDITLRK